MIITVDIHAGPRATVRWDRESGDPTGGALRVVRQVTGGPVETVQGMETAPNTSGVVPDWTVPLRQPVRYGVTHTGGTSWWSDLLTVDADRPTLIEPIRGQRATVTVVSWPDEDATPQTRELSVPGRPDPITIPGVMESPTSTIELLTFTTDEARALESLLADGKTVRLRGWGTVEDTWLSVRGHSRRRFAPHLLNSQTRIHTLEVRHTSMPDPTVRAIATTLGDLHAFMQAQIPGATLADIHDRWPGTLLDIAADPLGEA